MLAEFGSTDWREGGGCYWVAEALHVLHGYDICTGCYVTDDGRHIYHAWVQASSECIDATADQWGEPGLGIRRWSGDDPRYVDCGCGQDG